MPGLPDLPAHPPAFKQSPPAIPALGANMKKRRHGDEDLYYMHVSGTGRQGGRRCCRRRCRTRQTQVCPREVTWRAWEA